MQRAISDRCHDLHAVRDLRAAHALRSVARQYRQTSRASELPAPADFTAITATTTCGGSIARHTSPKSTSSEKTLRHPPQPQLIVPWDNSRPEYLQRHPAIQLRSHPRLRCGLYYCGRLSPATRRLTSHRELSVAHTPHAIAAASLAQSRQRINSSMKSVMRRIALRRYPASGLHARKHVARPL